MAKDEAPLTDHSTEKGKAPATTKKQAPTGSVRILTSSSLLRFLSKLRKTFTLVLVDNLRAPSLCELDYVLQAQMHADRRRSAEFVSPKLFQFFVGGYWSTHWDHKEEPKVHHTRNFIDFGPIYSTSECPQPTDMEYMILDKCDHRWAPEDMGVVLKVSKVPHIDIWDTNLLGYSDMLDKMGQKYQGLWRQYNKWWGVTRPSFREIRLDVYDNMMPLIVARQIGDPPTGKDFERPDVDVDGWKAFSDLPLEDVKRLPESFPPRPASPIKKSAPGPSGFPRRWDLVKADELKAQQRESEKGRPVAGGAVGGGVKGVERKRLSFEEDDDRRRPGVGSVGGSGVGGRGRSPTNEVQRGGDRRGGFVKGSERRRPRSEDEEESNAPEFQISFDIPKNKCGKIIGAKGAVVKNLQEKFHVKIHISSDGRVTLKGTQMRIVRAQQTIEGMADIAKPAEPAEGSSGLVCGDDDANLGEVNS
ncbi:hypothetical protein HK097_009314 [Rhizophlyctis rosea]|uniref:K Homology domain-containing protein n=1 Tax=Rhizophlyctis rosea TaxID=64517 RepID=A0AAD5SC66_9FUNG|nr:hypothetical protein HK097_009314 [Rhizophlyctis rosea]